MSIPCDLHPCHMFTFTLYRLNESTPISHGDTLHVPKRLSDFNGVYFCKVSNQYGSASGVLYVNNQTGEFLYISTIFICIITFSFIKQDSGDMTHTVKHLL